MCEKCCPGSRMLSQEVVNKWLADCCRTEDVSDPEKKQELLRNCCGQHFKLSEDEEGDERAQSGNCLCK